VLFVEWLCPQCRRRYDHLTDVCPDDDTPLVEDRTGQTIGGCVLQALIGVGLDRATVWEASRAGSGTSVAVKVQPVDDDEERAAMQAAARAAAALRHPGIVAIQGHGLTPGGDLYLVMELLEGETLAEARMGGRTFTPEQAVAISGRVLEALHYAHTAGVAHLDLKPANVFLAAVDGDAMPRVTLLDVGLGRPLPPDPPTALGVDRGADERVPDSLSYIAPEQLVTGRGDAASDLYSAGALFFEMLCGRPPFVGRRADLKRGHLSRKPPRIAELTTLEDADHFQTVLDRLLAKRAPERYASAAEARLAVEALRAPAVPGAPAADEDGFLDAMEDSFQNLPTVPPPGEPSESRLPPPPIGAPPVIPPYRPPPVVEPEPPASSAARAWPLVFALLVLVGVGWWVLRPLPSVEPVEPVGSAGVADPATVVQPPVTPPVVAPDAQVVVDAAPPPPDAAPPRPDAAPAQQLNTLASEPAGAEVRLADGTLLGTTPWSGLLPEGVDALSLSLAGHEPLTVTLARAEARRGGWSRMVELEASARPQRRRRGRAVTPPRRSRCPSPKAAPEPEAAPPEPEPVVPAVVVVETPVPAPKDEKKGPVVLGEDIPSKPAGGKTRVQTLGDSAPPPSTTSRVPVLK
jgi:serine/threonine protein kinase